MGAGSLILRNWSRDGKYTLELRTGFPRRKCLLGHTWIIHQAKNEQPAPWRRVNCPMDLSQIHRESYAQSLCIEIHWTGWSCMPYLSRISPLLVSRPSTRAIFEFVEPSPMAFPTRSWGAFGSQKSDHILYYWVGGSPLLLSTNTLW